MLGLCQGIWEQLTVTDDVTEKTRKVGKNSFRSDYQHHHQWAVESHSLSSHDCSVTKTCQNCIIGPILQLA